ncbi:hypothetical protein cypCar_00050239 [Cyprinus carpio]|nr:hypothetical protein cypCar_00050239 [Cyprinus carpio]
MENTRVIHINEQSLRRSRPERPNGAVRLSEKERKCRLKQVRTFSGNTDSSTTGTERATREEQTGQNRAGGARGRLLHEGRKRGTRDERLTVGAERTI